ncbi:MAG: chorismate-binding protein [Bacteroidia bacterium]|nr:chorismate-binding protein [Bacteroidia bacterium]
MVKGFAIFRAPGNPEIVAISGEFSQAAGVSVFQEHTFYLKPWASNSELQMLKGSRFEFSENLLQNWLNNIQLHDHQTLYPDLDYGSFSDYINFIQTGIAEKDFDKIVACRSITESYSKIEPKQAFLHALSQHPNAFVYMLFHPDFGLWMGATPERFLAYQNGTAETVALAGTIIGESEIWSQKEKEEQSFTAKYITEFMLEFGVPSIDPLQLYETRQGALRHLTQNYKFHLNADIFNRIIGDYHPTPAVGGYPKEAAVLFIERFEKLERELFTGWLGWGNTHEFNSFVNLRCARIFKNQVRYFAGCGINMGSQPDKEWAETEAKINVMRSCFAER